MGLPSEMPKSGTMERVSSMIGFKRRLLVVLLTLLLGGALFAAPSAKASTHTRMSWAYINDYIRTWHVGPNHYTYYGRIDFRGTWRKDRRGHYVPYRSVSYHPPVSPAIMTGTDAAANYCWPWELQTCQGWNNPGSWNWGGIWNSLHLQTTWNWRDVTKCGRGEERMTAALIGKQALTAILGGSPKAAIKVSPAGAATLILGACAWSLWH